MAPEPKIKKTYELSRDVVEWVMAEASKQELASTQNAVLELAVRQLRRRLGEEERRGAYARAAADPEYLGISRAIDQEYRAADAETWPG